MTVFFGNLTNHLNSFVIFKFLILSWTTIKIQYLLMKKAV